MFKTVLILLGLAVISYADHNVTAKCSCHGYLQGVGKVSAAKLFEDLGDKMVTHPDGCSTSGKMEECSKFCSAHISEMTNKFDLGAQVAKLNSSSLGQSLCDYVGVEVTRARVALYASWQCSDSLEEPGHQSQSQASLTTSTGDYTKQPLTCREGTFVNEAA